MLTFFSFLFVLLGALNWFFIGVFQYDFVAGFFGSQASLLSRLIYFIVGMAGFVILAMALKNRGKINITQNSFKSNKEKENKMQDLKTEKIEKAKREKEIENDNLKEKQASASDYNYNRFEYDDYENAHNISHKQNENQHFEKPYGFKDFDITQYD